MILKVFHYLMASMASLFIGMTVAPSLQGTIPSSILIAATAGTRTPIGAISPASAVSFTTSTTKKNA